MPVLYRKSLRILAGTFVVYALLVSTHLGEFWPFSIYPMFSRGGHPWVRSVVREAPAHPSEALWRPRTAPDALPGRPFPLDLAGINQNDVANFVSKSDVWDAARVKAMRKVFGEALHDRALLIVRAEGHLDDNAVTVAYTPFLLLTPDTTFFNPSLSFPTRER